MNEKEKMIQGKMYDPNDPELVEERRKAHGLCNRYNRLDETEAAEREEILNALLPERGETCFCKGRFISITAFIRRSERIPMRISI